MPVWRFRSPVDAARALAPSPDATTGIRTALALARFDQASARGVRISQRGVHRYHTVAEAELDRERYALARLRESDVER
jgi:hypothetical protein